MRTSPRSKDTRARARTSNTPNVHSWRHTRTSTRPKDTRARARTSNTPNVHSRRHTRTSPRSKDTRARARTSNTPNVHAWRHTARPLVPRTPVLVRVLQTLQMSIPGGTEHVLLVPRTPVARARTSNTPNVHSWRHTRTSPRSKDTRARARTSNTPDVRSGRQMSTSDSPTCTRTRAPTARVPSLPETPRTPARTPGVFPRDSSSSARQRVVYQTRREPIDASLSPTAIAVATAVATVASRAPSCRYRPPRRRPQPSRSIDRSVRVVTLDRDTRARVGVRLSAPRRTRTMSKRGAPTTTRRARARPPSIDRSTRATRDDARRARSNIDARAIALGL